MVPEAAVRFTGQAIPSPTYPEFDSAAVRRRVTTLSAPSTGACPAGFGNAFSATSRW